MRRNYVYMHGSTGLMCTYYKFNVPCSVSEMCGLIIGNIKEIMENKI